MIQFNPVVTQLFQPHRPVVKLLNFIIVVGVELPPLDSIRKYADDPEYDTIYINGVQSIRIIGRRLDSIPRMIV